MIIHMKYHRASRVDDITIIRVFQGYLLAVLAIIAGLRTCDEEFLWGRTLFYLKAVIGME
jgi:hypothetical protein